MWFNKANMYVLGWCIYTSQGLFLPKGTLFSQLLMVVLILVSLYHVFCVNTRYKFEKPAFFKGLNLLILMFSIYGIFLIIGGKFAWEYTIQFDSSNYLKEIYISLLPIYSFYVFFKEKEINEKACFAWVVVFFALTTGEYFENQRTMLLAALQRGSNAEEFTNNVGYAFLALIPACTFLYKRTLLQYVALGYCMLFLVMGMKRGAILIGAVCLGLFLWNNMRMANLKNKIFIFVLSVLLCFVGFRFVCWQMHESLYFQKRIENTLEGNSSGRDRIYVTMLNYYWNETTPIQFVFGSGANATLKVSKHYAHNDWLEILVNQGLLGGVIYMFFWLCLIKDCTSKTNTQQARMMLRLLFAICFIKTFFSMSYGDMSVPLTFSLGYSLAQEKVDEKNIHYV